jgi:hypothetical protein
VERHNHCLSLQVVVLQQTLLDDQVAVLALGREPLTYLDEEPVKIGRLLLVKDVQGTELDVLLCPYPRATPAT